MFDSLRILILAHALLLALFPSPSSAATVCDASLYGNPNPSNCSRILLDNRAESIHGLASKDRKHHLFYAGEIDQRPPDVTVTEWKNRVQLAAVTLSRGEWELDTLCDIFLAPGYDANGNSLHDAGTYLSIAEQATKVQNYCSHFPAPDEDQATSMEGGQGWIGGIIKTCIEYAKG
ncbi:MAG: hypothetical protein Q9175_006238 [Cornicularia normoerica]